MKLSKRLKRFFKRLFCANGNNLDDSSFVMLTEDCSSMTWRSSPIKTSTSNSSVRSSSVSSQFSKQVEGKKVKFFHETKLYQYNGTVPSTLVDDDKLNNEEQGGRISPVTVAIEPGIYEGFCPTNNDSPRAQRRKIQRDLQQEFTKVSNGNDVSAFVDNLELNMESVAKYMGQSFIWNEKTKTVENIPLVRNRRSFNEARDQSVEVSIQFSALNESKQNYHNHYASNIETDERRYGFMIL